MVEDLLDEDSVESPKMAVNADNFMHTVMQMNKAQVVYMCSSLFQLALGSRDLSQAEKKITKMTPEIVLDEQSCHFD